METESFEFPCACGDRQQVGAEGLGGRRTCGSCGRVIEVPDLRQSVLGGKVRTETLPYETPEPEQPVPPDYGPGDSVLGIRIEKVLEGGMGAVYIGWSDMLQMKVALKSFRVDRASPKGLKQFEEEVERWVRFGSAIGHITRAWALHQVEGRPFVMMEYVPGGDLEARMKKGGNCLSLAEALDMGLQFCQGMKYLWKKHKIVHLDIKPGNVLFEENGHLRISDFGLASIHGDSGGAGGTPTFMPPEQWRPEFAPDPTADVYAFGVMLYVSLTGLYPLRFPPRASAAKIRKVHEEGTYQSLCDISPNAGPVLEAIDRVIGRCLEKDPSKRWDDFEAVETELLSMHEEFVRRSWSDTMSDAPQLDSDNLLRDAQLDLYRGDIDAALEKADRMLEIGSIADDFEGIRIGGQTMARGIRLNALLKAGRMEEALETCDELLKAQPDRTNLIEAKAGILLQLERVDDADRLWAEAVERAPEEGPLLFGYATFISSSYPDRHRESFELLKRAATAQPEEETNWSALGFIAGMVGEWQAALEASERALALVPGKEITRVARAWANLYLRKIGDALLDLADLEAGGYSMADMHTIRSLAFNGLGLLKPARREAEKAASMSPEDSRAQQALAIAQQQPAEGEDRPDVLSYAFASRASEFLNEQRWDEAIQWSRVALAFERGPDPASLLVAALMAKGAMEEAEREARDVVRRYPDHFGAWYNLAQYLAIADQKEEALQILERLRKADSEDPDVARLYASLTGA